MRRINFRSVAVTLGATALYFFLVIWAWGDFRQFFADPARTGLVVAMIVLAVATSFSGFSGFSKGRTEMTSNRWVLVPLIIMMIATVCLVPYLDARNWWTIGGKTVRLVGLALFLIGGTIRTASIITLGHRFSALVAIQENHKLQTEGLYRVVRHPSYLGLLLSTAGWCLVFNSALGLLLTVSMLVPLVGRIRAEEKFMLEEFGEEYAAYRRRTRWRLLPPIY